MYSGSRSPSDRLERRASALASCQARATDGAPGGVGRLAARGVPGAARAAIRWLEQLRCRQDRPGAHVADGLRRRLPPHRSTWSNPYRQRGGRATWNSHSEQTMTASSGWPPHDTRWAPRRWWLRTETTGHAAVGDGAGHRSHRCGSHEVTDRPAPMLAYDSRASGRQRAPPSACDVPHRRSSSRASARRAVRRRAAGNLGGRHYETVRSERAVRLGRPGQMMSYSPCVSGSYVIDDAAVWQTVKGEIFDIPAPSRQHQRAGSATASETVRDRA